MNIFRNKNLKSLENNQVQHGKETVQKDDSIS